MFFICKPTLWRGPFNVTFNKMNEALQSNNDVSELLHSGVVELIGKSTCYQEVAANLSAFLSFP